MTSARPTKANEFDALVIGAGITGLVTASVLQARNLSVFLCDRISEPGGSSRAALSPVGSIDNGLKLIPLQALPILRQLEDLLDTPIQHQTVEAQPITFDSGRFQPFVGFGEQKLTTADVVNQHALGQFLCIDPPLHVLVARLISRLKSPPVTQTTVTKLVVNDSARVDEVILNGTQRLVAKNVYFCGSPADLLAILPETAAPGKIKQKIARGGLFSSVHLSLLLNRLIHSSQAIHVLKGANEEPCVGQFLSPFSHDGKQMQYCQWMTFVDRELSDEAEVMANSLKQIQRQLKRAYPDIFEAKIWDRIVVSPLSHGDLSQVIGPDGKFAKFPNLHVFSAVVSPQFLSLGGVACALNGLQASIPDTALSIEPQIDFHP